MKTKFALFLVVIFSAVGLVSQVSGADRDGNYLALKGGIYSPSATFNISEVNVGETFAGDTETGVSGEIAFGHYFIPSFALEIGIGYFQGKGTVLSVDEVPHQVDFDVIPIIAAAKVLVPVGPVAPYGEFGIGAYFTGFDVTGNANTFSGSTTFGIHAGGGLNASLTENTFIGVEGRYVWANPSFGDQKINLNDTEYALNGFELNGFTTMLALGFCF